LNLLEQPWYLGLAPLLGWLLDAVVRSGPLEGTIERARERLVARLEFAMRTGLGDQPRQAGGILSVWMGATAAFAAWALVAVGIVFGGPVGRFVATTLVFFAILDTRGIATDALTAENLLLAGRDDDAAARLARMGNPPSARTAPALAGAGVLAVIDGLLLRVLVPMLWGLLLGPVGGGFAFGVVAVCLRRRLSEEGGAEFWAWPDRALDALTWPVAWLASFGLQAVAPMVGVRRGDLFNGFIHRPSTRPIERLRAAIVQGFHFGEDVGGPREGADPAPGDIQRAVILMWTSSFLLLAIGSALRCGALKLL
jgi:cobalamin biosynthesis protein CobD/CbiB